MLTWVDSGPLDLLIPMLSECQWGKDTPHLTKLSRPHRLEGMPRRGRSPAERVTYIV